MRVVQTSLKKGDIQFQRAIPIEKRVAIVLWRLSKDNCFGSVTKYLKSVNQRLFKLLESFFPICYV